MNPQPPQHTNPQPHQHINPPPPARYPQEEDQCLFVIIGMTLSLVVLGLLFEWPWMVGIGFVGFVPSLVIVVCRIFRKTGT